MDMNTMICKTCDVSYREMFSILDHNGGFRFTFAENEAGHIMVAGRPDER
jgi:hypothetical protein